VEVPACSAIAAARAASAWPRPGARTAHLKIESRDRLRSRSAFQSAVTGKRFHSGRALVGFAVPTDGARSRVGVTVSKAVKGSVERNRARRRLREVARLELLGSDSPPARGGIRYDVVLIARPAALELSFADLRAEASLAALRLAKFTP
jgi:ribonuclease P protein component